MVNLTEAQIEKVRSKKIKDREKQIMIARGERPSTYFPLCEKGRFQKLTSLYKMEGLSFGVLKEYERLGKKYK